MYPFASLPANLTAFGAVLRRDHGFRIGPGEMIEAARALGVIELAEPRAVRDALRPVLSRTFDDASRFDGAFTAFFFPGPAGAPQSAQPPVVRRGPEPAVSGSVRDPERHGDSVDATSSDETSGSDEAGTPAGVTDDDGETTALVARVRYSARASEGFAPVVTRARTEWRVGARALVRRLQLGLSRRWRPARAGRRFDPRRTMRASLRTGGEALVPRWLARPRRTPRFVLLIDGSRSMSGYADMALQLAVALASVTLRVEVFAFSTALRRVTPDVRRAAAGEVRRLDVRHHAWGGGTGIGVCLRAFLRQFGERLLGRDTVVMIASDGLDLGEPEVLRDAMREMHRRSAGVVWLNPLLDTPGYEPTQIGMSVARPYVSTFASVPDAAGLARLAKRIRVRV